MQTPSGPRGLGSFLVGCAPIVLLCAVVGDGWRVWPLVAIWILGYGMRWASWTRWRHEDRQLTTDCYALVMLYAWISRKDLLLFGLKRWKECGNLLNGFDGLLVVYVTGIALSIAIPLALLGQSSWRNGKTTSGELPEYHSRVEFDLEVPKARIFPCQTTHARMFPKRHTFAYSYLQCGFPIVPSGVKYSGFEFATGEDRVLGKWWLRVRAEDYLARGFGENGFYWKLKTYLQSQHVEDSEWSYAYLVTAPRFFGYAFNPVTFWYIYDSEHQLKRLILEVNNTFGERRMYLLDGSSPASPPQTPESQASSKSEEPEPDLLAGAKSKFTDVWMKDFHVSPFNSRKGSYALKALDPFPSVNHDNPMIDNTITLKSSKDHAKLVARLYSTGKALDPNELGFFGTLQFVLSWWWVGLVTSPRIIREAFKLYTKRKLHVFFRPEVLTSSLGRLPTSAETTLHKVFTNYLFQLVHKTQDAFCITFKTAVPSIPTDLIATTHVRGRDRPTRMIEIRVLTPAFYSRLMHYTYTSEAFDRECIFTDERNRTLWICRPQLLALLISERSSLGEDMEMPLVRRSYLDELRWMLLKRLRCAPPDPAYSVTPQSSGVNDIRPRPYSELDNFVRSFFGKEHAGEYRRIVTKLFLAQRFCFGFPEIVGLVDLILRMSLCYIAAAQLKSWTASSPGSESAEPLKGLVTQRDWFACSDVVVNDASNWWWVASSAMSVYACHAYGLLKGYK